jgi:hypothetical protein
VLAPSERYYLQRGRHPNKLTDHARQLLLMVRRGVSQHHIVVVADSGFATEELLDATRRKSALSPGCGSMPLCMIRRRSAYLARLDGRAGRER